MKLFNKVKSLIDYKLKNHIEHVSPQPNRKEQLKIKNSLYRNNLALWLRAWRKYKSVKKAAQSLKMKNNALSGNLMQSVVYRRIRKRLSKKTSGYQGVSWVKCRQKWLASIKVNGKTKNIGRFESEEEAHKAYLRFKKNIKVKQI